MSYPFESGTAENPTWTVEDYRQSLERSIKVTKEKIMHAERELETQQRVRKALQEEMNQYERMLQVIDSPAPAKMTEVSR